MNAEIKELEAKLRRWDLAYRNGTPEVTDAIFDQEEAKLRRLHPESEVLKELIDADFGEEKELTLPMGSQDKALTLEELNPFLERTNQVTYHASQKADGMSAEVTYKKGKLVQVLTRGDGVMGCDITSQAMEIPSLPKQIPSEEDVIVRGEIVITKNDFLKLNQALVSDGKDPAKNRRNGTVVS